MSLKPSHEPLTEWIFAHSESFVLAEEHVEPEEEHFEAELEEFDEGDDLEADLAASLSTADRETADKKLSCIPQTCLRGRFIRPDSWSLSNTH